MTEWNNANMQNGGADPGAMTTDDLILMLGEAQVALRQKDKVLKYLNTLVQNTRVESDKLKSQSLSSVNEINSYKQQLEEIRRSNEGKTTYITALEQNVHTIALERDECKKQLEELRQSQGQKTCIKEVKGKGR